MASLAGVDAPTDAKAAEATSPATEASAIKQAAAASSSSSSSPVDTSSSATTDDTVGAANHLDGGAPGAPPAKSAAGGGVGAGDAGMPTESPTKAAAPVLVESQPLTDAEGATWASVQRCFAAAAAGADDPFAHLPGSGLPPKVAKKKKKNFFGRARSSSQAAKDHAAEEALRASLGAGAPCVVAAPGRPRGALPAECLRRYMRAEGWGEGPRGSPGNVRAVAIKLADMLAWRRGLGAARMLATGDGGPLAFAAGGATARVSELWPSYACGADRAGHILHVESLKHVRVKELRTTLKLDMMLAHRARCHESLLRMRARESRARGRVLYKGIYVLDLSGLSMSYLKPSWIKWLKPVIAQGTEFYPETLWRMYLVNAPAAVKVLWKIVKIWLDPETLKKIGIYGGPKKFRPAMIKDGVDPDALPTWLGGKGATPLVPLPVCMDADGGGGGDDDGDDDWPV